MGCIPVTTPALIRQTNHHQIFGDYKHSQQNVLQELVGEQQFNVKLYDFTTKAISYFYLYVLFDTFEFKSPILNGEQSAFTNSTSHHNIAHQFCFKGFLDSLPCMFMTIVLKIISPSSPEMKFLSHSLK